MISFSPIPHRAFFVGGSPYAKSVPGKYAVGDVRADSVKRVASALGEGSVLISYVHRYLASPDAAGSLPDSTLAAIRSTSGSRN